MKFLSQAIRRNDLWEFYLGAIAQFAVALGFRTVFVTAHFAMVILSSRQNISEELFLARFHETRVFIA